MPGAQQESFEAILRVLGHEIHRGHMQITAQSLFKQVYTFDSGQPVGVAPRLCERPAQLFEPRILLTLDLAQWIMGMEEASGLKPDSSPLSVWERGG